MKAIATYTIVNLQKISVISIKMISDNSIISEEYNREIAKYLEKDIYKLLNTIVIEIK